MILSREPRSLTTQMRMVKVFLDFVGRAAFSMEGQK